MPSEMLPSRHVTETAPTITSTSLIRIESKTLYNIVGPVPSLQETFKSAFHSAVSISKLNSDIQVIFASHEVHYGVRLLGCALHTGLVYVQQPNPSSSGKRSTRARARPLLYLGHVRPRHAKTRREPGVRGRDISTPSQFFFPLRPVRLHPRVLFGECYEPSCRFRCGATMSCK